MNKNTLKKNMLFVGMAVTALFSVNSFAQTFTVKVDNLTSGFHFTSLMVAAHPGTSHIFEPGLAATPGVTAMAEGGSLTVLTTELGTVSADITAANLTALAPGASVTTASITPAMVNTHLSIVGMLLPTNDAFVGMDNVEIPMAAGVYTYYLSAYDAGTEANNELLVGMPGGAPGTPGMPACPAANCGTSGTGVTTVDTNTMIHVHRGALGDANIAGGTSDLDLTVHRWLNPVARVTLTVN